MFFENNVKNNQVEFRKKIHNEFGVQNFFLYKLFCDNIKIIQKSMLDGTLIDKIIDVEEAKLSEAILKAKKMEKSCIFLGLKGENSYDYGSNISHKEVIKGYDDDGDEIFDEEKLQSLKNQIKEKQEMYESLNLDQNFVISKLYFASKKFLGKTAFLDHQICIFIDNQQKRVYFKGPYGSSNQEQSKNCLESILGRIS